MYSTESPCRGPEGIHVHEKAPHMGTHISQTMSFLQIKPASIFRRTSCLRFAKIVAGDVSPGSMSLPHGSPRLGLVLLYQIATLGCQSSDCQKSYGARRKLRTPPSCQTRTAILVSYVSGSPLDRLRSIFRRELLSMNQTSTITKTAAKTSHFAECLEPLPKSSLRPLCAPMWLNNYVFAAEEAQRDA